MATFKFDPNTGKPLSWRGAALSSEYPITNQQIKAQLAPHTCRVVEQVVRPFLYCPETGRKITHEVVQVNFVGDGSFTTKKVEVERTLDPVLWARRVKKAAGIVGWRTHEGHRPFMWAKAGIVAVAVTLKDTVAKV